MKMFFEWSILVMSVITVYCMTRKKYWWAPIVGLVQEIPWMGFAILSRSLSLVITTLVFTGMYAFAVPKWYKDRRKINGTGTDVERQR